MSLCVKPVCSNRTQLLWVNLIMDTMGALALATEDPNPDLLNDRVRHQHSIVGLVGKVSLAAAVLRGNAHLATSSWSAFAGFGCRLVSMLPRAVRAVLCCPAAPRAR